MVLIRRRDGHVGIDHAAEGWREAVGESALRPRAVDGIHLEATRRRYGIDVEFQRGLADAGSVGDGRQVELYVGDLLGGIDVECLLGAIVGGGIGAAGVGVAEGRDLRVCAGQQAQGGEQRDQYRQGGS